MNRFSGFFVLLLGALQVSCESSAEADAQFPAFGQRLGRQRGRFSTTGRPEPARPLGFIDSNGDLDLENMENAPFPLSNGLVYRDMLTISASQAVAAFSNRFQTQERQRINGRKANSKNSAQSPKFYSSTLQQPIGLEPLESLSFSDSRYIRAPRDLLQDRALADRDEEILIAERNADLQDLSRSPPQQLGRLTSSTPRPRTANATPRPPVSRPRGNYQRVLTAGHNAAYGQGTAPASTALYYTPQPPLSAVSSLVDFDSLRAQYATRPGAPASVARAPYSAVPAQPVYPQPYIPQGRQTVNYGVTVAHGLAGESYSFSSLG